MKKCLLLVFFNLLLLPLIKGQPGMKRIQDVVSNNDYIRLHYNNDVFFQTDRDFTQGITLEYYRPTFPKRNRVLKFLNQTPKVYKAFVFTQNIYTPEDIFTAEIISGSRPYASILYIGYRKVINVAAKKVRFTYEVDGGIIGPPSMGREVQTYFHSFIDSRKAEGWDNQIQSDIIANGQLKVEKVFYASSNIFDISGFTELMAGTLYDNAGAGLTMRVGRLNSYFSNLGYSDIQSHSNNAKHKFNFYGIGKVEAEAVFYDATLQGGMFNDNNEYVLPSSQVSKTLFRNSLGVVFNYGRYDLELYRDFVSKAYKTGKSHAWGHITLQIGF